MAIYKPSNLTPNLQEVDFDTPVDFSCQVNTSGSSVKAYKITIFSEQGDQKIYEQIARDLPKPILNKGQLEVSAQIQENGSTVEIDTVTEPTEEGQVLINGKNYQWSIRTYDAPVGSTTQPQTVVCTGFLVGSTQYVVWTKNNDKIETDRWIEFETTGPDQIFPIVGANEENIVLPAAGEKYRERKQIYWAEPKLGWNEDITKLEIDGHFKYSYKDGTPFKIFTVSDKHTLNSFYAEPNDKIKRGMFVELFNGSTMIGTRKKIIGYGELTGEIRVQEAWPQLPENGWTYKLYEYNAVANTYKQVTTSTVSLVVGGTAITDSSFTVMGNRWDDTKKQLFIQPNINIKTDKTNPNEIVFDNGTRLDIKQVLSTTQIPDKTTDVTFNKLDNTQWLLETGHVEIVEGTPTEFSIAPRTPYTVYTDFMDSMPYALFYARQTPQITLQARQWAIKGDEVSEYEDLINKETYEWRDIEFQAIWSSANSVQIRSYKYLLYSIDAYDNKELINETEDIYNTELSWYFRGFETSRRYEVEVQITDEYGNVYNQTCEFTAIYNIQNSVVPLYTEYLCDKHGIRINAYPPLFVESTTTTAPEGQITPTAIASNVKVNIDVTGVESGRYVDTMDGTCLNYTRIINSARTPIELPDAFTYLTRFRFPRGEESGEKNFFKYFNGNNDRTITAICVENPKEFWVNEENTVLTNALENLGNYTGIYLSLVNSDNQEIGGKQEISSYDAATGQIVLKTGFNLKSYNGFTYRIFGYVSSNDTFEIIPFSMNNSISIGGDVYELKVGSLDSYTIQNNNIRINPNRLKLKVYKNKDYSNPLYCFNGGRDNQKDLTQYIPNFTTPGGFSFVLQDGSQYEVVEMLPPAPDETYTERTFLLTRDCIINNKIYYQGVYQLRNISQGNISGYQWSLISPSQYFFFESTADAGTDAQGNPYTYDYLKVPEGLRVSPNADGGAINWGDVAIGENGDAGYIWMPDGETTEKQNLRQLAEQWFAFYMVVNPANTENPVLCSIQVDEGDAL